MHRTLIVWNSSYLQGRCRLRVNDMAPNRNALKRKLNDSVAQASTSCNGISIRIGHPIALQGLVYRDIYMDVPLDHSSTDASKETLYIHAREVRPHQVVTCSTMSCRTIVTAMNEQVCIYAGYNPGESAEQPKHATALLLSGWPWI